MTLNFIPTPPHIVVKIIVSSLTMMLNIIFSENYIYIAIYVVIYFDIYFSIMFTVLLLVSPDYIKIIMCNIFEIKLYGNYRIEVN